MEGMEWKGTSGQGRWLDHTGRASRCSMTGRCSYLRGGVIGLLSMWGIYPLSRIAVRMTNIMDD